MEPADFEMVKALFIQLMQYLMKYPSKGVNNERRIIQSTINIIESDLSDMEKGKMVIGYYKALFLTKGGLSEYNIWDNNFEKRKEINKPLDDIRDSLWMVMKKYI